MFNNYPNNYGLNTPNYNQQYNYNPGYQQNQMSQDIIYVQGIEGAKSYPVARNHMVPLFDSENDCFYIKASDANGVPQTLRKFKYVEEVDGEQNNKSSIAINKEENIYATIELVNELSDTIHKMQEEIDSLKRNRNNYNKRGMRNNG